MTKCTHTDLYIMYIYCHRYTAITGWGLSARMDGMACEVHASRDSGPSPCQPVPYIIPKSPVSKYYVPLFYRTEISDVKYLAHKS